MTRELIHVIHRNALAAFCLCLPALMTGPLSAQQFVLPTNVNIKTTQFAPTDFSQVIGVGDFNGDGRNDILSIYQSSQYAVLFANSDGSYSPSKGLTGINFISLGDTVQVADVDGDNRPDLVIVTSTPRGHGDPPGPSVLSVYLNNGDGTFRAVAPVTVANDFAVVALVMDLNKDKKPDIIIDDFANEFGISPHTYTVWTNQGAGKFTSAYTINSGPTVYRGLLTAGDFNGDGYPDVLLVSSPQYGAPGLFQVFLNQKGTSFAAGVTYAACSPDVCPAVAAAGDLNHDNKVDLVAFGLQPTPDRGTILLGNGDGTFRVGSTFSITPGHGVVTASAATIADINGDGLMDVAVIGGGSLQVFPGNGTGTVGNPASFNFGNPVATLADMNGDGKLDLLLSQVVGYSSAAIAANDDKGNFHAPRQNLVPRLNSIVTADFNKDGKDDVAVVSDSADIGNNPTHGRGAVVVYTGTGKGYFQPPTRYPIGMPAGEIAAGDVNGDGKMDLVVTRSSVFALRTYDPTASDVSVLLGNGDGTFKPAMNFTVLGQPAGSNHDGFATLADVNHDGKLDLIGDWGVALGKGDGSFSTPIPLPATIPPNIGQMAAGDFNGDGVLDLAVAVSDEVPVVVEFNAHVFTLLGDGKGNFTVSGQQELPQTFWTLSLAVADMDGDKKSDLIFDSAQSISATQTTRFITVRLGKGDGTFGSPINYPYAVGDRTSAPLLVADFNRDGKPDLLFFEYDGVLAVLLPGIGGGNLSATPQFYPTNLTDGDLLDVNGDGVVDVVGIVPRASVACLIRATGCR